MRRDEGLQRPYIQLAYRPPGKGRLERIYEGAKVVCSADVMTPRAVEPFNRVPRPTSSHKRGRQTASNLNGSDRVSNGRDRPKTPLSCQMLMMISADSFLSLAP